MNAFESPLSNDSQTHEVTSSTKRIEQDWGEGEIERSPQVGVKDGIPLTKSASQNSPQNVRKPTKLPIEASDANTDDDNEENQVAPAAKVINNTIPNCYPQAVTFHGNNVPNSTEAIRHSTISSQMYCGRRGDPRMHRAVAARLEKPDITLLDALLIGGFQFPNGVVSMPNDRGVTDADGVLLSQRKNQLSRRLRLARKCATKILQSAGIEGGDAAAAAVFRHNIAVKSSMDDFSNPLNPQLLHANLFKTMKSCPPQGFVQHHINVVPSIGNKTALNNVNVALLARAALAKQANQASKTISPFQGHELRKKLELQHLAAFPNVKKALAVKQVLLSLQGAKTANPIASQILRQKLKNAISKTNLNLNGNNNAHLRLASPGIGFNSPSVIPNIPHSSVQANAVAPHLSAQNSNVHQRYLNLVKALKNKANTMNPRPVAQGKRKIVPEPSLSSPLITNNCQEQAKRQKFPLNQQAKSQKVPLIQEEIRSSSSICSSTGDIATKPPSKPSVAPKQQQNLTEQMDVAVKLYNSKKSLMMQKCLLLAGFTKNEVAIANDNDGSSSGPSGGSILPMFEERLRES